MKTNYPFGKTSQWLVCLLVIAFMIVMAFTSCEKEELLLPPSSSETVSDTIPIISVESRCCLKESETKEDVKEDE